MNYSEMKDQVRLLLGETDEDNSYYTNAEINTQLNLSNLRVASDIPCLFTYSEVTTTADQQRYGLPSDFLQIKDLQMFIGDNTATRRKKLALLKYDEFERIGAGNVTMSGEPSYYRVEFGAVSTTAGSPPGDVWLYPVPDNNGGDNYCLRIAYYQKPTALSNTTDVSELPEFLHESVCYHAAWHLSLKDDNQSKINNLAMMYKDAITEAKRTVVRRDRTGPTQAKTSYGGSSLIGNFGGGVRRGPLR